MNSKVVIIGSYNADLFFRGNEIPFVGQTVIGDSFYEGGGGKGSNQAIAASMMGANTVFIGNIGNDRYGEVAFEMYKKHKISTDLITIDNTIHTGVSAIFVDQQGKNSIMVVPGANYKLSTDAIDKAEDTIKNAFIVGFQLENSYDVVEYGIKKADSLGVKTLLDPAPAIELPESIYKHIYYIKPNEHEASILSGIKVTDEKSAVEAGKWFLDKGVNTAIITLGEKGAVLVSTDKEKYFPPVKVNAVDTTGAGDCFSGALMASLAKGWDIEDAIVFANCASSISVTRLGVVEAIPDFEEVNAAYEKTNNTTI